MRFFPRCTSPRLMWREAELCMTATLPWLLTAFTISCDSVRQCCFARKLARCSSRLTLESKVRSRCSDSLILLTSSLLHPQLAAFSILVCYYWTVFVFLGEAVELEEYEASAAGLIQSFTQRFTEDAEEVEAQLLEISSGDAKCWCWEEHGKLGASVSDDNCAKPAGTNCIRERNEMERGCKGKSPWK